jgi:hypothetical protein
MSKSYRKVGEDVERDSESPSQKKRREFQQRAHVLSQIKLDDELLDDLEEDEFETYEPIRKKRKQSR